MASSMILCQSTIFKKKKNFPKPKLAVKKINYFSDGGAEQYKNQTNFLNLAIIKKIFNTLKPNGIFLAHDMIMYRVDGIGGTIKR